MNIYLNLESATLVHKGRPQPVGEVACPLVTRTEICNVFGDSLYFIVIPAAKMGRRTTLGDYPLKAGGEGSKTRPEAPSPRLREFMDKILLDIWTRDLLDGDVFIGVDVQRDNAFWSGIRWERPNFWNVDLGTPWVESAMAEDHSRDCLLYSYCAADPGFKWRRPPRIWFYDEVNEEDIADLAEMKRLEGELAKARDLLKRVKELKRLFPFYDRHTQLLPYELAINTLRDQLRASHERRASRSRFRKFGTLGEPVTLIQPPQ